VNKDGFLFLIFNFSPFFTSLNFVACNTSNFCDLFSQKSHIPGSSFCINFFKNLNFDQPIFDESTDFINIHKNRSVFVAFSIHGGKTQSLPSWRGCALIPSKPCANHQMVEKGQDDDIADVQVYEADPAVPECQVSPSILLLFSAVLCEQLYGEVKFDAPEQVATAPRFQVK
jgi:hypothetical protein